MSPEEVKREEARLRELLRVRHRLNIATTPTWRALYTSYRKRLH